jgi:cholesterol oxidase
MTTTSNLTKSDDSSSEQIEILIIGSGFGGSVAALRFAEAGHQVVVLERGDRVSREKFQVDLDAMWNPARNAYGFHDIRSRGKHIIPWVGAAVGGGSHVYAGTLKRRESFEDFPTAIAQADMAPYYVRAEAMLGGSTFPDWPPYSEVRATQLMNHVGEKLKAAHPELVEDFGPVHLGISFAPKDGSGKPGATFINAHGCEQRYYDPREQSILGGDIDTKNSLDRNYLFLAEKKAKRPIEIRSMCQADRIDVLADGRYQVTYRHHRPSTGWAGFKQRWLFGSAPADATSTIVAKHLVVAAGCIGSNELLLRNRDVYKSLELDDKLGTQYTTNGDYLTLIVPFKGFFLSWGAFIAMVVCLFIKQWYGVGIAAVLYYLGLFISAPPYDPDVGTTNSDHIRWKGHEGQTQGAYIESGRYPTPLRMIGAVFVSAFTGKFRPTRYRTLASISNVMRWLVPPFGALARTYPIPLLSMGKDDAYGTFQLDGRGHAFIKYDIDANKKFYQHLEKLGKLVGKAADAYWLPDIIHKVIGRLEVPHNQGGIPMGNSPRDGMVDHAGRVFGMKNLMVLDGSIIPHSIGPNPALTITAIAERAMEIVVAQLATDGEITAPAGIL